MQIERIGTNTKLFSIASGACQRCNLLCSSVFVVVFSLSTSGFGVWCHEYVCVIVVKQIDASLLFYCTLWTFLGEKNQACFNMSFPNCSRWTHSAPMDTHDSVTKTTPQLMVLRHGALSGFCSISILMKRLNAFLDWMKSRGGSSKGWEDHKPSVCGPSELWSLRCCLVPVPLASSVATVSLTNCLPKWVNGLLRCSGNPLSSQRCFLNHCLYGC